MSRAASALSGLRPHTRAPTHATAPACAPQLVLAGRRQQRQGRDAQLSVPHLSVGQRRRRVGRRRRRARTVLRPFHARGESLAGPGLQLGICVVPVRRQGQANACVRLDKGPRRAVRGPNAAGAGRSLPAGACRADGAMHPVGDG